MTWRLTIRKPITLLSETDDGYTIEGTGPPPVAEHVFPPGDPPDVPPIGTTLPPEVDDTSPFVWPPQPGYRPYHPEERYAALGDGCYAGATTFANPQPGTHLWAGTIREGRIGSWDLEAYDLWAPRDAKPEVIRRLLKVGRP